MARSLFGWSSASVKNKLFHQQKGHCYPLYNCFYTKIFYFVEWGISSRKSNNAQNSIVNGWDDLVDFEQPASTQPDTSVTKVCIYGAASNGWFLSWQQFLKLELVKRLCFFAIFQNYWFYLNSQPHWPSLCQIAMMVKKTLFALLHTTDQCTSVMFSNIYTLVCRVESHVLSMLYDVLFAEV